MHTKANMLEQAYSICCIEDVISWANKGEIEAKDKGNEVSAEGWANIAQKAKVIMEQIKGSDF